MFVVSLNHKKAMAEFREKLSFDDEKRVLLLERLKEIGFEQILVFLRFLVSQRIEGYICLG